MDLELPANLPEPSAGALRVLEELNERRRAIAAIVPADRHQAVVRRYLLATLDQMEEALCLHGPRAPELRDGWRQLGAFASFDCAGNGRRPARRVPPNPNRRR